MELFRGALACVSLAPSKNQDRENTRLVPAALLRYYSTVCDEKLSLSPTVSATDLDHINEQTRHGLVMKLDECDIETFDMVLQWMYTGNVIINSESPKHSSTSIELSNLFETIQSYIQFFKIAKVLQLKGSFKMVEEDLRDTLIAAAEKERSEDYDAFTCHPLFKTTLADAFTNPVDESIRELLASFLVEPYINYLLSDDSPPVLAKTFEDLFQEVEGFELKLSRLVCSALNGLSLGKRKTDGFCAVSMRSPLTGSKFNTGCTLKVDVVAPKVNGK